MRWLERWVRGLRIWRDIEDRLEDEIRRNQELQDAAIRAQALLEHYQSAYLSASQDAKEAREKVADILAMRMFGKPIFSPMPPQSQAPQSPRMPFSPTRKVQARHVVEDLTRKAYRDDIARLEQELNLHDTPPKS